LLQFVPKSEHLYVGCSGNFTIDRILSNQGYSIHSNDVSLYSKTISEIVLGKKSEFICIDPIYKSVFSKWKDSKFKSIIQIMFVLKTSAFRPCKNDYQKSMWESYLQKSDEFYEKSLNKFEKNEVFDFKIDSFHYGDFRDHISEARGTSLIFAPTYKGGYEKIYQTIEEVFEYERAVYSIFDSKAAGSIYLDILEKGKSIIYSDIDFKELSTYKRGVVQFPKKRNIFLYSNVSDKKYFFTTPESKKDLNAKIIPSDFSFSNSTKISIAKVQSELIFHYKHLFMSSRVNYSENEDFGIAFLADGMIFGFAGFNKFMSSEENLFLSSDFVFPSGEKRLSKLLIMLLLSKEIRKLLIRHYIHAYQGLKTSVYTEHPISMKYRGIFELLDRKKGKLVYQQEFKNEYINEVFIRWFKTKRK